MVTEVVGASGAEIGAQCMADAAACRRSCAFRRCRGHVHRSVAGARRAPRASPSLRSAFRRHAAAKLLN